MIGAGRAKSDNRFPCSFAALKVRVSGFFPHAIRTDKNDDLPTVIVQGIESRSADDVVEIIYLQNDTDRTWVATVRADFSVTVDDESGAALHHGPAANEVELAPGERARIGDILGWEWDSSRGLAIEFRHPEDSGSRRVSYNLDFGGRARHVAGLGEVYEVEPITVKPPGWIERFLPL